ncbi:MAG: hypothetical protein ACRERC_15800 [Candidatus Binatia bacterium]
MLSDVEHAVGNLLQRMHHAARGVRAELAVPGERLQGALEELEGLLDLLFDYVSPVDVSVRPTEAALVAESLAAQLRAQGAVDVVLAEVPAVAVLADGRALSRGFLLLARACGREWQAAGPLTVQTRHDAAADRVEFTVESGGGVPPATSAQAALAGAVASRLIELQGGELRTRPRSECICQVALPVAG